MGLFPSHERRSVDAEPVRQGWAVVDGLVILALLTVAALVVVGMFGLAAGVEDDRSEVEPTVEVELGPATAVTKDPIAEAQGGTQDAGGGSAAERAVPDESVDGSRRGRRPTSTAEPSDRAMTTSDRSAEARGTAGGTRSAPLSTAADRRDGVHGADDTGRGAAADAGAVDADSASRSRAEELGPGVVLHRSPARWLIGGEPIGPGSIVGGLVRLDGVGEREGVGVAAPELVDQLVSVDVDQISGLDSSVAGEDTIEAVARYWSYLLDARSYPPVVDPDALDLVAVGAGRDHLADLVNRLNGVEVMVRDQMAQLDVRVIEVSRDDDIVRLLECTRNGLVRRRFADVLSGAPLAKVIVVDEVVVDQVWDVTLERRGRTLLLSDRMLVSPEVETPCQGL